MRSGPISTFSTLELRSSAGNLLFVLTGGQNGSLVDEVFEIGAGEAGGLLGDLLEVGVFVERLAVRVDFQNGHATTVIGCIEGDAAVEAAGAQQSWVEDVGAVGGRHDDDVGALLEAVHLDQDLVERLLALVVTAAHAGAALAADGVDLVDEDDAGCVLLGLHEQVAHAAGADTDEHFDEVRTGDREERHAGLPCYRSGQQSFTGSGRAEEQDAFGDLGAQGLEFARDFQKFDDLCPAPAWPRRRRQHP